jgi:hypothetical protein
MNRDLFFLIFICFLFPLSVAAQKVTLRPSTDPTFKRNRFTLHHLGDKADEVIINGRANESFWENIPIQEMRYDITYAWWSGGAASLNPELKETGDYHVGWRAAMDNEYFYILCDIIDDVKVFKKDSVDFWKFDNIELYFLFEDESVVMPDLFLTWASWIRIYANTDLVVVNTFYGRGWVEPALKENRYQPHGMRSRTRITSLGYTIEAKIPFSLIIPSVDGVFGYYNDENEWIDIAPPQEMKNFQFDLVAFDQDIWNADSVNDPNEAKLAWSTNWNRNFLYTEGYGIAEISGEGLVLNADGLIDPVKSLQVFPNPASVQITLRNLSGNADVYIIDMLGQIAKYCHWSESEFVLDISSLEPGFYLIRTINTHGEVAVGKFVKR